MFKALDKFIQKLMWKQTTKQRGQIRKTLKTNMGSDYQKYIEAQ